MPRLAVGRDNQSGTIISGIELDCFSWSSLRPRQVINFRFAD